MKSGATFVRSADDRVDLRRDHREIVGDKHDVRVDRRQIRRTVTP